MRAKTMLALLALLLLPLASCATEGRALPDMPTATHELKPVTEQALSGCLDPVYAVSETIDIDRPGTYPPMPESVFSYVERDAVGQRVHYAVTADLDAVVMSGKSGTMRRTGQTTVLLFADGTGLVLLGPCQLAVGLGPVLIDYSVPPGMTSDSMTTVLVHSIREAN